MPMVEFRYNPEKISEEKAARLGAGFEESFRVALSLIREKNEYGLTVEGDPFHIHFNQPDLRIYIFYHQEWNFTKDELSQLAFYMGARVENQLKAEKLKNILATLRFYARAGHESISIPLSQK
mgnify:CR=1 FL=1